MWESGLGVALQGTSCCNCAPVSPRWGGVGEGSSYKMTDDGKKLTNLESNTAPDLFGKRPNTVSCSTFCVTLKTRLLCSTLMMIFL